MKETMQAAVLESAGKIVFKRVEKPSCPAGGLLLRVIACGVCSTDVKVFESGHRDLVYPRILGHEIVGIIVQSQNEHFKTGQRVQVYPGLGCGGCDFCISGESRRCNSLRIVGFSIDGGFAEYLSVPYPAITAGGINSIPDFVGDTEAVLTEPLASCINAQEKVGLNQGETLLIIGAGPLGLLHARLGRHRGAGKIIIADCSEFRLSWALRSGIANMVINTADNDIYQTMMADTYAYGADIIIMATSHYPTALLLPLLNHGGRLSLFSGCRNNTGLALKDINEIHYRELTVCGAYGSTPAQNSEALNLIAVGFPVNDLITKRFPLESIDNSLKYTADCLGLKALICY